MKNKTLRTVLSLCLCLLLLAAAPALRARAEDVYIEFSDPAVGAGGEVAVKVACAAAIGSLELELAYDTDYLNFTGYSGGTGREEVSARAGQLTIKDSNDGEAAPFAMELYFSAVQTGETSITVSSCAVKDSAGDSMSVAWGSAAVTINAGATDSSLGILVVEPGELSPEFDPAVTEYTVTVSEETLNLMVTARPNDGRATAYVEGHDALRIGENRVTVTVTARDGSQTVYTILTTREGTPEETPAPEETPDPEETEETPEEIPAGPVYALVADGSRMEIGELPAGQLPQGYAPTVISFEECPVAALRSADGTKTVVWLLANESNDAAFYYFDAETGTARPMNSFRTEGRSYIVLDAALAEGETPEGCVLGSYSLTGLADRVFLPEDEGAEYVVFYGSADGESAQLYLYDTREGTVQRCGLALTESEAPPLAPDPSAAEAAEAADAARQALQLREAELAAAEQQSRTMRRWAEVAAVAAMVLLVCCVTLLVLWLRQRRQDERDWP